LDHSGQWTPQVVYRPGEVAGFAGQPWRCVQGHQAAPELTPPGSTELWRPQGLAEPDDWTAAGSLPDRTILCCAGEGYRWGDHLGVPKHLAPFDGRPLLERTVAQLRSRGLTDLVVTACDPRYRIEGTRLCAPQTTILPDTGIGFSSGFWSSRGRTVVLLGDVYFSEAALDAIIACPPDETRWLGRKGAGSIAKNPEMFGVSIPLRRQQQLRQAAAAVVDLYQWGVTNRIMGWELYAVVNDLDATAIEPGPNWLDVDDETEDFDYPRDYVAWMKRYRSGP
jgi:hypothetical protein